MRIQKIAYLNGGEILAKTVMTPDYKILLSEGTKLRKEYIEKLGELGVKEVFVEDEINTQEVKILKDETGKNFKDKVKNIIEKHTYSHSEELVELSKTADHIINNLLEEEEVVERIYDIKERSSDIYEHPIYGYSALKNETWISELSKDIILYHHENMDGSGYPLKSIYVPIEVKIVNICERFDEMICGIGYKPIKVFEAIHHLKKNKDILYDGNIVDVLLEFTAVYPAGSYVLTNEGEIGIVLRQNKNNPDRPFIKIIYDKRGNRVQYDFVKDLLTENNLYIEKVIENI